MKEKLETGLCLAALLVFLYVAAYFALARQGITFEAGGRWAACPRYVGLPNSAEVWFRSLHNWDRTFLRSGFWAGTVSREHLLAAAATLEAAQAATKLQ